jgi:LmbE family N-acetylglucosaminyl deacetylase
MADHRHVGLAVVDAVRDAGNRWVFADDAEAWRGVRMVLVNASPFATHYVDVTDSLERGIASLECHAAYLAHVGQDARSWLTSSSGSAGRLVGVPYAATFEVLAF